MDVALINLIFRWHKAFQKFKFYINLASSFFFKDTPLQKILHFSCITFLNWLNIYFTITLVPHSRNSSFTPTVCYDRKHCVKIAFRVFKCFVALEKMSQKKIIFDQHKKYGLFLQIAFHFFFFFFEKHLYLTTS